MKSQAWIVCSCSAAAGPPCRTARGSREGGAGPATPDSWGWVWERAAGPVPGDVFYFQGRNNPVNSQFLNALRQGIT